MESELIEDKVDWKGRPARKDKHGGTRTSLLILGSYTLESMATLSLAVNLVTYFTGVMHFDVADSANQLTNLMGTTYIVTIIAATLADTYIGRFKAILTAASIEFLGLGLMSLQAHYKNLRPTSCALFDPTCTKVDGANAVLLFIALYMVGVGSGGMKAALPSHGADQFDDKDPKEAKEKSSFFNWFLLSMCIGGAISLTFFVWIQDHKGWDWGFAVSTLCLFLAIIVFAAGLPRYRIHVVNGSSALVKIAQVYVAAIRNRHLQLPEDSNDLYEVIPDKESATDTEFLPHTNAFRFLDKAAIPTPSSSSSHESHQESTTSHPWKLCTVTQVENAKIILNLLPIFLCTIMMTLCLAQLQTFSVQQGLTMDKKLTDSFSIPPASLPIIPIVFLLLLIPLYDKLFVPFARTLSKIPTGITYLQRVGVGLLLFSLSMAVAALVEVKRKRVARENNLMDANPLVESIPLSVFWLSFQYFIFGVADMFTYVGLLEFFYHQLPRDLRSISSCFLWISMALGYFLSTILVKVVNRVTRGVTGSGGWLVGNNLNRNHLNLFYWMLAVLSLVNFFVYLFVSRRYKYRVEESSHQGLNGSRVQNEEPINVH